MENVEQIAHEVLLELVRQRSPGISGVENRQTLTSDLGLRSLDLAQLVVMMELRTGKDPFLELVPITSLRTVGDLVAAYRTSFAPVRDGADEVAPPLGEERAESRRRASRRRRADRPAASGSGPRHE